MGEMLEFTVASEDAGGRLDVLVTEYAQGQLTRSAVQKLIRDGACSVNQKTVKANYRAVPGDQVSLFVPEPETMDILPEDIPLDILYEDPDLIVVNKPKGMVVHPAAGHADGTLVNALLWHCGSELSGINGVQRPGIVHRIDRNTTGSLVVCKSDFAHQSLAQQLKDHTITRKYRAIVCGGFSQDSGTIDRPIGRHRTDRKRMAVCPDGREAVTHYTVLERFGRYTYIECVLETGRTHQIRVHMASISHPLLGDDVYGGFKPEQMFEGVLLQGQVLHAMVLGFIHPRTGEYMEFSAPLPEYFQKLLEVLRNKK